MKEPKRPEWSESHPAFSTSYMPGIESTHDGFKTSGKKKFQKVNAANLPIEEIARKLMAGDRIMLSKAITLIESNAKQHFEMAQDLLNFLLSNVCSSIRIGITGVPGAGKSTFIEEFGCYLCDQGHKVAVLAVDPSSTVSGGSILGDKTRMEKLAKHPNAFIRPSPSTGTLGGVHRKTRESITACEAAGYDIIIVETVGVGQSEVMVRGMVDFFLLLSITGAGDELQGMKKGIMELADAIIVNKADGENKKLAEKTKREYNQILHFLMPATKGWETKAYTCSALNGDGIPEIWRIVNRFSQITKNNGVFTERRRSQLKEWMFAMIQERLENSFFQHSSVKKHLPIIQNAVMQETITVAKAVDNLFHKYQEENKLID
ncbi:methylmalonyl Co-A mutase-associated GTPase MeaB [Bacillus sp. FJAT-49736]|uniref:methylmalonyl Co-A mutase-associated GTPase MeaB n=1 Tax=Bacillus sp. FJAT-49736 TaxID=2833582 RepID=UPI001BC8EF80|nr:methylmalonyl Co-A mutase-associated GTPase MeaB [Bacillus sp. FJAT-49736]MBS4173396.1 methylmalonyl Co-A mutase-associated GTPase MeaB [Bacillus sp. FJAT-49736]